MATRERPSTVKRDVETVEEAQVTVAGAPNLALEMADLEEIIASSTTTLNTQPSAPPLEHDGNVDGDMQSVDQQVDEHVAQLPVRYEALETLTSSVASASTKQYPVISVVAALQEEEKAYIASLTESAQSEVTLDTDRLIYASDFLATVPVDRFRFLLRQYRDAVW
jgi:hypothetical protein